MNGRVKVRTVLVAIAFSALLMTVALQEVRLRHREAQLRMEMQEAMAERDMLERLGVVSRQAQDTLSPKIESPGPESAGTAGDK